MYCCLYSRSKVVMKIKPDMFEIHDKCKACQPFLALTGSVGIATSQAFQRPRDPDKAAVTVTL